MDVYKVIAFCDFEDGEVVNFRGAYYETYTEEEARENFPELDPNDSRAIAEYGLTEYSLVGTAKQIKSTYNQSDFYNLEGDEDEICDMEEEFTELVNALE